MIAPFGQPSSATTVQGARLVADTTMPKARLVPMSGEEDTQFLGQIDQRTGAPMNLRTAVAAVRRPAQKLEILRRVDPNAQPYGKGNFVYTPPGASEPILFDPKGFKDVGKDVIEGLPFLSELGGSIAGGIGGAAVGGVPGALGGAALGGAAARDVTEQGMMAAAGQQDPRNLGQRAADVGTTGLVSAAGEGVGRAIAPAGRTMARVFEGTPTGSATRAAAERIRVPLTAGMATGRRFFQQVEGALSANPLTGHIMHNAARQATEAAQTASGNIVRAIAGGGDTSRGSFAAAVQGAAEGRLQRFKNVRQTMDDVIGSIIPPSTLAPLDNTEKALGALLAFQSKAPMSLGPEVGQAVQAASAMIQDAAANGGMLPFDVLRRLRTTIGEAASFGSTTGDRVAGGTQHLRDLYTALGDDVRAAGKLIDSQALAAGLPTPGAEQAVEIHDAFVRLNRDPKNPVSVEAMQKLMETTPANPAQWATTLVKDPRRARALREAVRPEEWDAIAGSIFEDMGRASGANGSAADLWNPNAFLDNWKRLNPAGREALFGGTRYGSVTGDISALAQVAEGITRGSKFLNTSNTAGAIMLPLMMKGSIGAGVGALTGDPVRGAAAGLGLGGATMLTSYAASKLLTSPRVMAAVRGAVTGGVRQGPSFLGRLVAIGRVEEELRGPINEYIAAIGQAGYPLPDPNIVNQLNTGSPGVQYAPR